MDTASEVTIMLYAYEIKNNSFSRSYVQLVENLMKLDNDPDRSLVSKRKHEGCLLSYYKINESTNRFFGMMMEIASEATIVSDRLDSEFHIEPKELKKLKITKELICKEFYFFLAGKKYMITTLPNNKMPKLIKYLKWLLENYSSEQIEISSLVRIPKTTQPIRKIGVLFDNKKPYTDEGTPFFNRIKTNSIQVSLYPNPTKFSNTMNKSDAIETIKSILTKLIDDDSISIMINDEKKNLHEMLCSKEVNIMIKDEFIDYNCLENKMNLYMNEL